MSLSWFEEHEMYHPNASGKIEQCSRPTTRDLFGSFLSFLLHFDGPRSCKVARVDFHERGGSSKVQECAI
jgi:hypothetical protein